MSEEDIHAQRRRHLRRVDDLPPEPGRNGLHALQPDDILSWQAPHLAALFPDDSDSKIVALAEVLEAQAWVITKVAEFLVAAYDEHDPVNQDQWLPACEKLANCIRVFQETRESILES